MTIVPDSKDWTWVLRRPCPECGLDTASFPREAVAAMVRENARAWQDVLAGPADPRRRSTQTALHRLVTGLCKILSPILAFTAD